MLRGLHVFRAGYGMTESTLISFSAPGIAEYKPGNLGNLTRFTELKIVDFNTGKSLGPNESGEIWVRGPQRTNGYLKNPKATGENIDADGWLHTGDIGYYDDDQCLFVVDRLKEMFKYQSCTVYPAEIEQFLLTHES